MFTECFLGLEPPKKGGHERVLPEELEELNLDPTVLSGQAIQIPIPPEFLSEDGSDGEGGDDDGGWPSLMSGPP